MPYLRPILTQLRDQSLQDIQSGNLGGVSGLLQRSVLRVLAYCIAGLSYLHYGYQDYIAQESVPWTATDEALTGWGALKDVTLKPATLAVLDFSFGGTAGAYLPPSTLITVGNLTYSTLIEGNLSPGGQLTVPVVATETGSAYNLAVGTPVALQNPAEGINSAGVVVSITTTAADIETQDAFRTRMLQVYASPPQGGAQSDYVTWAEGVPGVTRAWCSPEGAGAGTVVVYTMFDLADAAAGGFPKGVTGVAALETRASPATSDLLTVANAIFPLRPVTALVFSVAPQGSPITFTVADVFPFTATTQAAISTALADLFLRIGTPLGMTIYPSDWNEAIASVAGLEHFAVTSPSPGVPIAIPLGFLPTVGAVTVSA